VPPRKASEINDKADQPSSPPGTIPLRRRRAHNVVAAPSGKGLLCWRFQRRIHGVKRCVPWASKICNLDMSTVEHSEDAEGSHRRTGRTSGVQTHLLLPLPPRDEGKHHHHVDPRSNSRHDARQRHKDDS
jgi:hypothetical protein